MQGFLPDPVMVEVLGQGSGQPCRVRLTLPDGSGQSGELDLAALSARQNVLLGGGDAAAFQDYGQFLFQSLFPGNLAGQYLAALQAAHDRGIRLSLCLDPQQPGLHHLPWECLYQPQGSQWSPLATAANVYLSRYLQAGKPWSLPLPAGPLKALVVISGPFEPGNNLYVDTAKEQAAIDALFKPFEDILHYDVLPGPVTAQQLADQLNQGAGYDILHYVGHGDWRENEQIGYLILTGTYGDGTTGPIGVSAAELSQYLSTCPRLPQLIFLAACESGQQSTQDAFAGVGPQMVAAGCPAVVCMQTRVEMDAARQFAQGFYERLFETGCVDLAANRARGSLQESQFGQWAVPVVYMHLVDGILFDPEQRFRPAQREPYRFLAPYQPGDADLFKGRGGCAGEIYTHICEQPVTVLYGEEGVGLTSLLEAGLRPKLETEHWLVVSISQYGDLAGEFRVNLTVGGRPLMLRVGGDAPLPDLLRAISPDQFAHLALFLDQFERVFQLDADAQQSILQALQACQQSQGGRLSLVLALHKDALPGMIRFQALTAEPPVDWIEVDELDLDGAVEAILGPLDALGWPVTLTPALARNQIAPDLGELSEDHPSNGKTWVDPGQLQITCTWLYRKARSRRPPLIDEDLYVKEAGGAEGILARYMEDELQNDFADQSSLAKSILVAMAAPDQEHWVAPDQITIHVEDPDPKKAQALQLVPVETIRLLLDRLVKVELLSRRLVQGRYLYAFVNLAIADEVRRIAGKSVQERYQAGDELERIWRLWLAEQVRASPGSDAADAVLATRYQLRLLAESKEMIDARPVKYLMLLRSAVLRGEPAGCWLGCLSEVEGGGDLITALEMPGASGLPPAAGGSSQLDLARRLLGLDKPDLPKMEQADGEYGDISWAAVAGKDRIDRGAAVLALMALPAASGSAWGRLVLALEDLRPRALAPLRRSELFGTLAEAGLEKEKLNRVSPGQKLGMYLWRARRRMGINSREILSAAIGAGIGGGLALGLERLLVGQLAQSHVGTIFFALFSYWGLLLAGLGGLGVAAGAHLLLDNPLTRRSQLLAVKLALGFLLFGAANLLVAALNGISLAQAPLAAPLGFAAGIGLSFVLAVAPPIFALKSLPRWALLAVLAGLVFALVEWVFLLRPQAGSGISIALSAGYLKVEFDYFTWAAWKNWMRADPAWPAVLALLEAFLSGLALALGALIGRNLASRWAATWQKMLDRVDE